MPRRTYAFRRRIQRRRMPGSSWRKFGARAGGLAYRAYKSVKYLKSLINVEKKFLDTTFGPTNTSTTPTVTWLTTMPEGNDYNNRAGISVKATSIHFKGLINLNVSGFAATVRCMLIVDLEGLGTAPSASDILETSTDVLSPLNHINGKRFQILSDKFYSLGSQGNQTLHFKLFKKLNQHIRWSNSTTGTREGHIYMLTMSDQSSNVPSVSYDARLRFIDN